MNGKKIAKLVQQAISCRLLGFPAQSAKSKTGAFESNFDRRSAFNDTIKEEKSRVAFGDNFQYENGFEIFMLNAFMNRMCKEDEPDAPYIEMEFNGLGRSIDVKTVAKIILFGLSTDMVYSVPCETGFVEYAIDRVEGLSDLHRIGIYFKCIGSPTLTK